MTIATKEYNQESATKSNTVVTMPDHFYDIIASNICNQHQLSFVARQLKGNIQALTEFESSIYRTAKALCFNSNVVGWDIKTLAGSIGFYMESKNQQDFHITDNHNYCGNTVDYRTFGLIVTLKSFSDLASRFESSNPVLADIFKTHFDILICDIQKLANYMQVDKDNIVSNKERSQILNMYKVIDRFTSF